jgi:hypothetical protein
VTGVSGSGGAMFADAGKAAIKASEAMKLTFASVDMV